MTRTLVCAVAALLASATFAPAAAFAEAAPESVLAERIASGRWNRFRVVTARSTFEFTSLHSDSMGIRLEPPPRRPAIVTTPDAHADAPRSIRWSEIEHVDAARTHAGKGAVEGAIVGGLVGLTVTVLVASNVHDESALGAISATPLGIVFGALTGAGFWGGSRWTRIYP